MCRFLCRCKFSSLRLAMALVYIKNDGTIDSISCKIIQNCLPCNSNYLNRFHIKHI
nr:MAG TPA_asm: hypothetical protein [Caudoviricetes sp.]